MEFFQTSTRNLLAAEAAAGVGHHVALSVVGTERLPDSGYFRAKIAQEQLIKASPIPYSIVHATQFFEFIKSIADGATDGNTVRLAPVLVQPIAADDVAEAVGTVAVGPPLNGTVEVAGTRAVPPRRTRPTRPAARDGIHATSSATPTRATSAPSCTNAPCSPARMRRSPRPDSKTGCASPSPPTSRSVVAPPSVPPYGATTPADPRRTAALAAAGVRVAHSEGLVHGWCD